VAFFVAFYSYKGGVGRTLALANAAYALAARGKRVVLLDMDLEAPGLQDFPEFALKGKAARKGVVDFAAAYAQTGQCPPIEPYVHRCKESPGSGELWLMPAGSVGAAYQLQIGKLPWRRLHPKKGTAPFVEGLRTGLIEYVRPHYVLIDSRTGLSDIGGLSTHRLADMVVLVFNLTRSCLEGSVRTYRSFVSDDSTIRVVQLVASPVPPLLPERSSLIERRLVEAAEAMPLGIASDRSILRVDYNPAMVLSEELAVRHSDAFPAAARYQDLCNAIQRANLEDAFATTEQVLFLRRMGKLEEALELLQTFVESHPADVDGYLAKGSLLLEAGRASDASEAFRAAIGAAPDLALAHRRLGEALIEADDITEAIEALQKAGELGDKSPDLQVALASARRLEGYTTGEVERAETARVLAVEGGWVLLSVGEAEGARNEMRFAVYPPALKGQLSGKRVADVEVRKVGATESWAQVVTMFRAELLPGGLAVPLRGGEVLRPLLCELVSSPTIDQVEALRRASEAIVRKGSGAVKIAGAGDIADLKVGVNERGEYEIVSGVAPLRNLGRPIPVTVPGAEAELLRRLIHLANYFDVERIINGNTRARLNGKFQMTPLRIEAPTDSGGTPAQRPLGNHGPHEPIELRCGEHLVIEIENASSQAVNVVVLDLQPDWGIEKIFPVRRDADFWTLEPKEKKTIVISSYLPPGCEESRDVIKAFATVGIPSLLWRELPPLYRIKPDIKPVGRVTRRGRGVLPGTTPKPSQVFESFASQEWTTTQIEVRVRR